MSDQGSMGPIVVEGRLVAISAKLVSFRLSGFRRQDLSTKKGN